MSLAKIYFMHQAESGAYYLGKHVMEMTSEIWFPSR
jgi:hypothetical protein